MRIQAGGWHIKTAVFQYNKARIVDELLNITHTSTVQKTEQRPKNLASAGQIGCVCLALLRDKKNRIALSHSFSTTKISNHELPRSGSVQRSVLPAVRLGKSAWLCALTINLLDNFIHSPVVENPD